MLILIRNCFYFFYNIDAIHESLSELGFPHEIVYDYPYDDDDNIYLTCTTHELGKPVPKHYISYNFEQLTTEKKWDERFFERLRKAKVVFDYSLENIKILEQKGIKAYFLPVGYAKCGEYNYPGVEKIYDFAFPGLLNDKRQEKINSLEKISNHKVFCTYKHYGRDLEILHKQMKIGINIHYYEKNTILEVHRIIPMIINKVWVVSERGYDPWYDNIFKNMVDFVDDDKFAQGCLDAYKNYNEEELEKRYQYLVNNCKYIDYIKNILHLLF